MTKRNFKIELNCYKCNYGEVIRGKEAEWLSQMMKQVCPECGSTKESIILCPKCNAELEVKDYNEIYREREDGR